jgi:hypothetical protein
VRHTPVFRRSVTAAFSTLVVAVGILALAPHTATASPPPSAWTLVAAPSPASSWYAVAFGGGQWVALGHTGDGAVSADGTSWTEYPVPAGSWQSVTYGNGRFVALSSVNATPHEMISTNGITWTALSGPAGEWTGLTYGGGRFVGVDSLGQIITSKDALRWSVEFSHSKVHFTSVAYGGGRFIAVDGSQGATVISPNGVGWSYYPAPTAGVRWGSVVYGNGNFVAFDGAGSGYMATTVLGYVWTLHQYSPAQVIEGATYGCGSFFAAGQSTGSTNNALSSTTGATWTATAMPTSAPSEWTSVAYGEHEFVAVDSAGDIATMKSTADCASTIPAAPKQVSGNIHNGEVWTYMHPPSSPGVAPIDGYRVTVSDGTVTKHCYARVYYEPNCIIKGLKNRRVYTVTAQSHSRFGYSVPTDPESVIPVASWRFTAVTTTPTVSRSAPVVVQITGVLANREGIYPSSFVTVHFGARLTRCRPSPFGECLITVVNPSDGPASIYATYTGYGVSYRSPTARVTVVP